MANKVEVSEDELTVEVSSPFGVLTWDKQTDTVSMSDALPYSVFIQSVKALKRTRNRASLEVTSIDD